MNDTSADELITRINLEMRQAMKDGRTVERDGLRSLLARISSAEAVSPDEGIVLNQGPIAGASEGVGSTEALRRRLTESEVRALVQAEIAEMEVAQDGLDPHSDYVMELSTKVAALRQFDTRAD